MQEKWSASLLTHPITPAARLSITTTILSIQSGLPFQAGKLI